MTTDPYTAVASVIGSILGLRQCVTLSHTGRPLRTLAPETLAQFERALAEAERLAHDERLHRVRESMTERAA
ncbi:MAG: hypothetical protein MZV65_39700 [Chromatiales bacterium]|nr:hypothetical protein [Chromatiales bacterium]MCK7581161.1 hypothetical protein [Chromatiales bacterium]